MNVILLYLIHIQIYLWLYQWHFQKTNKIEHTSLILKTIFASLVCEWLLYKFSLSFMMQLYIYIVHVLAQQGSVLHVKILLGVQNTEANKSQNKLQSFVYFIYVHFFHVYTNVNEWMNEWIEKNIGIIFILYQSRVTVVRISLWALLKYLYFCFECRKCGLICLTHTYRNNLTNNKIIILFTVFLLKKKISAGWRKWENINLITTKSPPNIFL